MISIKKCKELLGKKAKEYTEEQIELLRKYLLKMAKLNIEIIKNHKEKEDEESSNNVQSKL